MLTFSFASFPATRASEPGLLRSRTTNAGSSMKRYLARRSARLASTASFTITRTLPRPLTASADSARQCAAWITKRGGDAVGIVCDTTDESQVEAMVGRARGAYGGVDILVNNAGLLGGQSVLDMSLERWSRQLAVNLTGTFLCTKHVARVMVEQARGGSIIVIVS